jgi:hypothetical protein
MMVLFTNSNLRANHDWVLSFTKSVGTTQIPPFGQYSQFISNRVQIY